MAGAPRNRKGKSEYHLGTFLKDKRLENGWTREEAAEKIGLTETQLQYLENSKPKALETLEKVLEFYGYKLSPARLYPPSKSPTENQYDEIKKIIEQEFSGNQQSTSKSQLVLAGRIIEIMKQAIAPKKED